MEDAQTTRRSENILRQGTLVRSISLRRRERVREKEESRRERKRMRERERERERDNKAQDFVCCVFSCKFLLLVSKV